MTNRPRILNLAFTAAIILVFIISALADTIRLKDGSVIKGKVVGFSNQQFEIEVGGGSRGRKSTMRVYMEDVESVEFDNQAGDTVASATPVPTPAPTIIRPNPTPTPTSTPITIATPVRTPTPQPTPAASRQGNFVTINSNVKVLADNTANGWTNSGFVVRRGQKVRVTAKGNISIGNGKYVRPDGDSSVADKDKLVSQRPTGSLIAVIGDDNDEFIYVGSSVEFISQRDGTLFLGINEGNLDDNSGAFEVVLEAEVDTPGSPE